MYFHYIPFCTFEFCAKWKEKVKDNSSLSLNRDTNENIWNTSSWLRQQKEFDNTLITVHVFLFSFSSTVYFKGIVGVWGQSMGNPLSGTYQVAIWPSQES